MIETSHLSKFTPDQQALLVSLPYRTGLWVSESDDDGGHESDEAEKQALETMMVGYAEDFLKSEFVEELVKQTLAEKDKWGAWAENLTSVPDECRKAVDIINTQLDSKESLSFRQTLMEIAMAVALAYREIDEGELSASEKMKIYGEYYWQCFMAKMKSRQPPNLDEFLNISHSERTVLVQLSEILRVNMDGSPIENSAAA